MSLFKYSSLRGDRLKSVPACDCRVAPAMTVMLLLATLFLSSCGFQLRGSVALTAALQSVYIGSRSAVANELRSVLVSSGATLHTNKSDAVTVLQFRSDTSSRRVLSTSSAGRVLEYELERRVDLDVINVSGERTRLPGMVLTRDLLNDEENVLGTTTQETAIRQELVRDMAQQIVRRLNVLLKKGGGQN